MINKKPLSRSERRRLARENFKKEVLEEKSNNISQEKHSKSVLFLLLFLGFTICFLYAFIFGLNLWVGKGFVKYIGWAGVIGVIFAFIYTWVKKRNKTSLGRGVFLTIPLSFILAFVLSSLWVFLIDSQLERKKLINTIESHSEIIKQVESLHSNPNQSLDCEVSLLNYNNFVNELWDDDIPATKREIDMLVGGANSLYSSGCDLNWGELQGKLNTKPVIWSAKSSYKTTAIYNYLNRVWPKNYYGCRLEANHHASSLNEPDLKNELLSFCTNLTDKDSFWPGPIYFNDFDFTVYDDEESSDEGGNEDS